MHNSKICETTLVRVLPLSDLHERRDDQYAIVLRDKPGNTKAGCRCCDFKDGTVSFYRPDNAYDAKCSGGMECMPHNCGKGEGWILLFSEELLRCSESAWKPEDFSFFGYCYKESLHVSAKEKRKLEDIFTNIVEEQEWGFDKYSCRLILREIEMLLIYCKRFYDRQFQMRSEACGCLIKKIEEASEARIRKSKSAEATPEAIAEIATATGMSPAYLSDYIKQINGLNINEFLLRQQISIACRELTETDKYTCCIAKELGYNSARQMRIIFENVYGMTPKKYRMKMKNEE